MLNNLEKIIILAILIFMILPACYAADNDTNENICDNNYYFDISQHYDGNGSINNPYKYLKSDRIKDNSNIYVAGGEYELDAQVNIENVTIFGQNQNKTTISFNTTAFNVKNNFKIQNIKLSKLSINNTGNLIVKNVIFEENTGSLSDEFKNTYGGAIHSFNGNVTISDCTFIKSNAEYGGAIYMNNGFLNITESSFINTYSYNYGGAIACESNVGSFISKTKFINTYSLNDAGGALYIKASSLKAASITINNSSSTFGGAITLLKSDLSLNLSNLTSNHAAWEGGAIYQIYGNLSCSNTNFINNTAQNGGALFIDDLTTFDMKNNIFMSNKAYLKANAIYCVGNNYSKEDNIFGNNQTVYECQNINLAIGNGNYTLIKLNSTDYSSLPSYYSLIDENHLTNVKHQQTAGNCWAFAAMAVLESCILKATGQYTDLSEENMKNIMALYSDYGWTLDTNNGAYAFVPFNYLVSWLGPVSESDDEYDDKSCLSPVLDSIYHIQNIKFLRHDNFTDNDEIKQALIQYGAVGVGMAYHDHFLNKKTNGYYSYANIGINHAVTIVGWDDNYSKYNFRWSSLIKGDGAWIVRNSWGSEWADNGYFYVSYYDPKFALTTSNYFPYTFVLNETIKNDKNYQHDIGGITNYFITPQNNVYYKNVFTATDDEFLTGVSTYFEKQCNWTLSVSINDELKLYKVGISNPGYYTINLDKLIPLAKGDVFEVIFNITSSKQVSFPVSESKFLNKKTFTSGISFMSFDGENWIDLSNFTYSYLKRDYTSQIACIKAFTILNPINTTLTLNINETSIKAIIKDCYGNLINNGNVTFSFDDKNCIIGVKNGKAILNSDVIINQSKISAVFDGAGYMSSVGEVIFEKPFDLKVNIIRNLNNILINVISQDNYNQPIIININNDKYYLNLINGSASLNLENLSNGFYNISIISPVSINKLINIHAEKTRIIIKSNYEVVLIDDNGLGLSDKNLRLYLNNLEFNLTTDKKGCVNLSELLKSGNNSVKIIFGGDEEYFKSEIIDIVHIRDTLKTSLEVFKYSNNVSIQFNTSQLLNGSLTIKINDVNHEVKGNNKYVLNLSNLENGHYTVNVLCNRVVINSTSFDISVKKATNIILKNFVVNEDEFFNFNATLTDINGKYLSNKNITIKVNNNLYMRVTNEYGKIYVRLKLKAGEFKIQVTFDGDNDFYKSNQSGEIRVLKHKMQTKILSHNLDTFYNLDTAYTVTLCDINNNPLSNQLIYLNINNITYLRLTGADGKASLNINLKNGEYLVNVSYFGNEKFLNSTKSFKITVKSSIIAENNAIKTFNSLYPIKIVDGNGDALINSKVYLFFDSNVYLKTTDDKGYVYLTINCQSGDYPLKILNINNGEEVLINIKVVSRIAENKDLTFFEYVDEIYRVLLFDDGGKALANTVIQMRLNNKFYNVKTDNNGFASLKLNLPSNRYTITVYYNDFKASNIIIVKSLLFAKNMIFKKSKSYKFQAKLLNKAQNKKIIFKIKNKSYTVKTNKKGIATIKIKLKLKRGVYKIYSYCGKSKIMNKIRIK